MNIKFCWFLKKWTIIFDEKTVEKIEKKFDSFISSPLKDKSFKFKKLKNRKNEKEISFMVTESELTDDEIKKEVKKLKSKNNIPPTDDKLNYFRPWVEFILIGINFS